MAVSTINVTLPDPLYQILEQAVGGIAQIDTSGRYLLVNAGYCNLLGRGREQLLNANVQDFTHPDDLPASLDAFIRAIETGTPVTIDQRYLHADGSTVRLSTSVSVGRDTRSKPPEYLLLIAHDITNRTNALPAQTGADNELRELLDCAADGLYVMGRDGKVTLCNAAFRRMLGFEREEDVLGRDVHDDIHHSHADGSRYPKENCPIHKAARSGTPAHGIDEIFFRQDGTSFPVEYWVRPIFREGEIQGAVCTFVDLTERKQAEARQQLLNHELAHRVKNTLAMVQAIVGQTLRNAASPREAIQSVNERLVALGNAHTILTRTRWGNASIMEVVEGAIAVHRSKSSRIKVTGPRIDLGAKAALTITLALHELCTNAAKYGALSNDTGSVALDWTVTGGAADASFQLTWKESGGPPVTPPTRKGFGSRLIAEAAGSDLHGETKLSFDPDGVLWTLQASLASVKQ